MFEKGIMGRITQARFTNMQKLTISIYVRSLTLKWKTHTFSTKMSTTFMVGLWFSCSQLEDSNWPILTNSQQKIVVYDKDFNKGYVLEVNVKYPKEVHDLHNDLPFMCEKMKITKVENLFLNLHDKTDYKIHIRVLNRALKHWLVLEKVY